MKKLIVAMLLVATSMTLAMGDADAKRLGGGGSSGRQSANVSRQQATPPASNLNQAKPAAPAANPAAAPTTPPKPASPWKGIVGGLIGGALLGALFSSMGFGGAMSGMLGSLLTVAIIAALVMFAIKFFRSRQNPAMPSAFSQPAYAGMSSVATSEIGSRLEPQNFSSAASVAPAAPAVPAAPWGVPADFDTPGFLRNAKTYFIRLQAAWDAGNINDIREFTTSEMFAEIRLELQERGTVQNVTDVVSINAELLGMETQGDNYLASVQFSGMIKESTEAQPEAFKEVWNLSKPVNGQSGWLLADIQQIA